jgi:hypothetical protein
MLITSNFNFDSDVVDCFNCISLPDCYLIVNKKDHINECHLLVFCKASNVSLKLNYAMDYIWVVDSTKQTATTIKHRSGKKQTMSLRKLSEFLRLTNL